MIISLTNATICLQQQLVCLPQAAGPAFACRLNYARPIMRLNRGHVFPVRSANGYSKRGAYLVSDYEGLWEDPDDGSDESEYEDDSDDEMEENGVCYESKVEGLSARKHEEALVREVEQMLTPKERAVLEQNEAPNLEKLSTAKWKPLHTSALAQQINFMDGLLEKGYNIDLADKDGLTALHFAVIGKRESVISHLLRKGANPEAKDQDGATPLHYAAQVGPLRTVKLLVKCKVDVNVADNEGWTPLHVAMQTRNRDIVKVLLVNGADGTRRNKDGNTPLDLSLCYGKDFRSYELSKLVKQVSATRGL